MNHPPPPPPGHPPLFEVPPAPPFPPFPPFAVFVPEFATKFFAIRTKVPPPPPPPPPPPAAPPPSEAVHPTAPFSPLPEIVPEVKLNLFATITITHPPFHPFPPGDTAEAAAAHPLAPPAPDETRIHHPTVEARNDACNPLTPAVPPLVAAVHPLPFRKTSVRKRFLPFVPAFPVTEFVCAPPAIQRAFAEIAPPLIVNVPRTKMKLNSPCRSRVPPVTVRFS